MKIYWKISEKMNTDNQLFAENAIFTQINVIKRRHNKYTRYQIEMLFSFI